MRGIGLATIFLIIFVIVGCLDQRRTLGRHTRSAGAKQVLPAGWRLEDVTAMSADGQTLAGWGRDPDGVVQAFVLTVPEPGAGLLLLASLSLWVATRDRRRCPLQAGAVVKFSAERAGAAAHQTITAVSPVRSA